MSEWTTYLKKLWGVFFIGAGSFFLIEHILVWDEIAFFDFIGHEWLGVVLIAVGALMNTNWNKSRLSEEITGVFKWLNLQKQTGRKQEV